ncbi:MAG: CotH kinase family protein [Myxococcales bacterium]|nr:CotH kinase family protein [Myxococcales bacterium]
METLLLVLAACRAPTETSPPSPTPPTTVVESAHTGPTGHTGVPDPEPEPSGLLVTEIMSANGSTVNAPDGSLADWVELYDGGDEPIALDRVQLRDGAGNGWTGAPEDGVLEPGERRLVWLGSGATGGPWTGFALDRDGDELVVIVDDRLVEVIDVPPLAEDLSFARLPDPEGEWAPTAWPTPGTANGDAPSPTLDVADATWFVTDTIHTIELTVGPAATTQLDQPSRPEVHAAVRIDGVSLPADVGLRLKGSASYQGMDGKPSFVVDTNAWVPGTHWRGLKGFKLHNGMGGDTTRVKEHLAYTLAREAGLMSPRVGWAQVLVDGVDYGLYVVVEVQDDRFIARYRPTEAETGVVLEPADTTAGTWGDFGNGSYLHWDMEEGPVPPDPLAVEALARVDALVTLPPTDANLAELFTVVEERTLHSYMAWEAVVMHSDGYISAHNFRVYVSGDTHLVSLVPAGADLIWRMDSTPFYSFGSLAAFCLHNEGCRHDYAARLIEVADLSDSLGLADQFVDRSTFLDPAIQADPRYPIGLQWVEADRQASLGYIVTNPDLVRSSAVAMFPDLGP